MNGFMIHGAKKETKELQILKLKKEFLKKPHQNEIKHNIIKPDQAARLDIHYNQNMKKLQ